MGRRKGTDHFDLLPYIAILMCTLGTLLLMTLSMTAINVGPGAGIGIVPAVDANMPTKQPVLIEWDGRQAFVHREQQREAIRVDQLQIWVDGKARDDTEEEKLESILEDLTENAKTQYALFAVRPSGFSNFMSFRERFDRRRIPIGYEPFEQDRPLRLLQPKFGPISPPEP
jgi:hypothetical protein